VLGRCPFTMSNTIALISPARFLLRRLTRRLWSPSMASVTIPALCGPWGAATVWTSWVQWPFRILSACSTRPLRSSSAFRNMAAFAQLALEDWYVAPLSHSHRQTRLGNSGLAGGVALKCAANGKIFEQTPFRDVYIQPAANDPGTSLGAALYVRHQILHQPRS